MNLKAIIHGTLNSTVIAILVIIIGAVIGLAAGSVFIWSVDRL